MRWKQIEDEPKTFVLVFETGDEIADALQQFARRQGLAGSSFRTQSEVTALLDAVHRAVVKAFHVPVRDRYQVYQAHPKGFLIIQDTGLNISRTDKALHFAVKRSGVNGESTCLTKL